MSIANLKQVAAELGAHELKIMCTGEMDVDWKSLLDLQTLEDGRSLKATDDEKISRLAESLLRFGIVNNLQVWVDENNRIYCFDAHHRKKAFKLLEKIGLDIPPLPATRCLAENITDAKCLLLVKESRSSWVNIEIVPAYMEEVKFSFSVAERVIDLPELEWGKICETKKPEKEADEIPDPPAIVHIKTGDLAELGGHRLLCGDSTSAKDVARLMNGEKADMVFADPPYFIGLSSTGLLITQADKKNIVHFFNAWVHLIKKNIKGHWYICTDWRTYPVLYFDIIKLLGRMKNLIVWDFEWIKAGNQYRFTHELIMFGDMENKKQVPRCEADVWRIKTENFTVKRLHGAQKPVALSQKAIINSDGQLIYDPFLGSGTTMIAAEKTGRRCFGIEIDPYYCQISIQRWVDFTGQDKIKINGKEVLWSEYIR